MKPRLTSIGSCGLRSSTSLLGVILSLASLLAASAQNPSPVGKLESKFPLPTEPLMNSAPDFAKWTVTISYEEERQATAPGLKATPTPTPPDYALARPRKVTTTKTGHEVLEEIIDLKGRVSERWFHGATQFTKASGSNTWEQKDPSGVPGATPDPDYAPPPDKGFRDVGWVAPANYAGTIKYGNSTCLVFIPGGERAIDLTKPEQIKTMWQTFPMIACVEARSRLPVAVRYLGKIRTFTWDQPPAGPLVLPAGLSAQIKKQNDDTAKLLKQAARP
ncbi:MAG: hypothetical protein H0X40_00480 [Chthoniobacterales bacterium]|nr:hypothetical protein [Chthoniobacterales bacterium]